VTAVTELLLAVVAGWSAAWALRMLAFNANPALKLITVRPVDNHFFCPAVNGRFSVINFVVGTPSSPEKNGPNSLESVPFQRCY